MQPEDLETGDAPEDPLRPGTLFQWLRGDRSLTLLDIRPKVGFEEWHISGPDVDITNIPAYEFIDGDANELLEQVPAGDPLVVVCAEGKSSALIAGWLASKGYDAVNLAEGMDGWARVYASKEITAYDGPGTLLQYQRPSSGCLGYLLYDGGEAAVFDPLRTFTEGYVSDVAEQDAELKYAADTHIHADHISGVRELVDRGVEGILPKPAVERGVAYVSAVTSIEDGETISVGSTTIQAVHTPGHTTGMTSYRIDESVLLTGDGLFTDSVARPDLEAGAEGATAAASQLYHTLTERILTLPEDTILAGGHTSDVAEPSDDGTYTARLGDVTAAMTVLELDESSFVDRILSDMPPRPANYEQIIAINLGQESADPEEAFELELGPNNCATSRAALR